MMFQLSMSTVSGVGGGREAISNQDTLPLLDWSKQVVLLDRSMNG